MSNSQATVVPETRLVDVVRTVYQILPASDPSAVQRQRRLIATQWLKDLCTAVRAWNLSFIALLNEYPGKNGSSNSSEYSSFFHKLVDYHNQLQGREGEVKDRLCRPLEHLNMRLFKDFDWLKSGDPNSFAALHQIVEEAYQNEVGVIRIADMVIREVFSPDAPEAIADVSAARADATPFLDWHIAHRGNILAIIQDYKDTSEQKIDEIRRCGMDADGLLLPVEEYHRRSRLAENGSEIVQDDQGVTTMSNESETVNQRLYTLLAFSFGVVFLSVLLYLTSVNPNPTKEQLRIWTAVLALAGGAVATVMSGLINVKLTLGKQLAVGATGALAVFVIIYFRNPAVIE